MHLPLVLTWVAAIQTVPPPVPSHKQDDAIQYISGINAKAIVEKLESFGTRHTLSQTDSTTRGIGAAREWIKSELENYAKGSASNPVANPRLKVEFESFDAPKSARLPEGGRIVNIVATLPGAMPEAAARRYYFVGHYDSRNAEQLDAAGDAPGANDNASGVAVVMECARALATDRFPLDATVVFLLTAGEEQGLIGASYHVSQALARGENIGGVLNNDIVGDPSDPLVPGSRLWMVRVFSEGLPRNPDAAALSVLRANSSESDSSSRQLARFVDWVAAQHEGKFPAVAMVFRQDRFLRGGDHIPFNDAGIPAVRFTVSLEHFDRQHVNVTTRDSLPYGDVSRYINGDYLGAVAKLNLATMINLASAPASPANVRIVTSELSNQTVIRWNPSPEPDVVGYEIVYRATVDSQWNAEPLDAGRNTEFTTKLSKDDHFFGVRACDRNGYRSPVSFAVAGKE